MASTPGPQSPRKGNLWRTVKAVAWSMLGVRKSSEWQEDGVQVTPLQVIAVGLVAIFLFVLGLMALVQWLV